LILSPPLYFGNFMKLFITWFIQTPITSVLRSKYLWEIHTNPKDKTWIYRFGFFLGGGVSGEGDVKTNQIRRSKVVKCFLQITEVKVWPWQNVGFELMMFLCVPFLHLNSELLVGNDYFSNSYLKVRFLYNFYSW
jgi:hypothetical protein